MGTRSILGRICRATSIRSEEIVQRMFGMFYRQCKLVIDGKYNSNDGLSTTLMINMQIKDKSRKIE
jgi:hypothetical protein